MLAYRDIADTEAMIAASRPIPQRGGHRRRPARPGSGQRPEDARHGRNRGASERLADGAPARSLAGGLLQESLEARGIRFKLAAQTEALVQGESGRVCAACASRTAQAAGRPGGDGGRHPSQHRARRIGRPSIATAASWSTTPCRPSPTRASMRWANACSHRGVAYGLVAPLFEQAKVLANHLAEFGIAALPGLGHFHQAQGHRHRSVLGRRFHAAARAPNSSCCPTLQAASTRSWCSRTTSWWAPASTATRSTAPGTSSCCAKAPTSASSASTLLFGQHNLGDSGHGPTERVAALPDSAEICGCNGVCKGTIVKAIRDKKLFTLDEVRTHTKASVFVRFLHRAGGGGAGAHRGGDYSAAPSKKPLCACTDHSHDEVIATIRDNELKSMGAVINFLEWKTPDGCATCRPALNYYLLARWPGEYKDDAQSRFINERAHGNIQKDGSFSVVPRMWGGLTNAERTARHRRRGREVQGAGR